MPASALDAAALRRALALRDLTDPAQGPHAMQLLVDAITTAICHRARCPLRLVRASPIVTVEDNYDRLRYPADGPARELRYTRYLEDGRLLRTQTTAMIPPLLRALAPAPESAVLLACPGLVYRRDSIDRLHAAEPHQLDLWLLAPTLELDVEALDRLAGTVIAAALPGSRWRAAPATHPYTLDGLELQAATGDEWVEVGECGRAHPLLLRESGMAAQVSGLAIGLGLDRLLMLRKRIPDIRLLRCEDPRVASQLLDLQPWRPVSHQPSTRRDLSLAVAADATAEDLGDQVRDALGPRAASIEEIRLLSETSRDALPTAAIARLGISPGQKNVLVRVVLRELDRTLTAAEANQLRDEIYRTLHRGTVSQWASVPNPR